MVNRWLTGGALLVLLVAGCTGGADDEQLRPEVAPIQLRFQEVAREVGIEFISRTLEGTLDLITESTGTGLAWLDYDQDGDWDLYAVTGAGLPNALFRNDGGRFVEVAAQAGVDHRGWGMGVAAGDYDGDGYPDLFVTNFGGPDVLYHNRGDGTFEDVTDQAGVGGDPSAWSTSATWVDVDGDGDLDLYVLRYIDFSDPYSVPATYPSERNEPVTLIPDPYPPQPNALYRNNGDGTFTEIAAQVGADDPRGKGLGVVAGDLDDDGDWDLYLGNDVTPNALLRNDGDGTFTDISFEAGVDDSRNGMGVDLGDYDGDGDLDIFCTNWQTQTNVLYRNNWAESRRLNFDDVTAEAGLAHTSLGFTGWGALFADFDLDGDLDLFLTNGYTSPDPRDPAPEVCVGQPDHLFRNDNGRFVRLDSALSPPADGWGSGRGAALADYDNDGDLDIAVAQNNGRLLLFRNDTPTLNAWLQVEAPPGSRIVLTHDRERYVREVTAGSGYLSTGAPVVLFGVIAGAVVDRVQVRFSDGSEQTLEDVPVRRRIRFRVGQRPEILPLLTKGTQ
ncbi:MAG: RNA-binding protein [Candidatus Poribacteria bacterium]|nr:MAG: RNA-binding protein [Candidatus Poribacteria bacterium]